MRRLRFLLHIPRGTIKVALYLLFLGVLVFVAATQTQVGRDGLKNQLVNQFNDRFHGSLEIGKLTGNLANRFVATGIKVRDPNRNLIAELDTIVVEPYWINLLRGQYRFKNIRLNGGFVRLVETDTSWNVIDSFIPIQSRGEDNGPFLSSAARIELSRVELQTISNRPAIDPIDKGILFDYGNSTLEIGNALLTVDWEDDSHQVDILEISSLVLNEKEVFESARGQMVVERGRFDINRLTSSSPDGAFELSGSLGGYSGFAPVLAGPTSIDLSVVVTDLTPDQAKRVSPAWPFQSTLSAELRGSGQLDNFVFTNFAVSSGTSELSSFGKIVGLPDSARFDVSAQSDRLIAEDLASLIDDLYVDDIPFDSAGASLKTSGLVDWKSDSLFASHSIGVISDVGTALLQGDTQIQNLGQQPRILTAGTLESGSVNLSRFKLPDQIGGGLTGRSEFRINHHSGNLFGAYQGLFTGLEINGERVDSLHITVDKATDAYEFAAQLVHEDETLETKGTASLNDNLLSVNASMGVAGFNVGNWFTGIDSLASRMNASLALDLRRRSENDFDLTANLRTDSSIVQVREDLRTINRGLSRLIISARPDSVTAELNGSLANARLSANADVAGLYAHSDYWRSVVSAVTNEIVDKPFIAIQSAPQGGTAPHQAPLDSIRVDTELRFKDSQTLSALLFALPSIDTDAVVRLSAVSTPESLSTQLNLRADSVDYLGRKARDVRMRMQIDATGANNADYVRMDVDANAESLHAAGQTILGPDVAVDVDNSGAVFRLASAPDSLENKIDVRGTASFDADKNRFNITRSSFRSDLYVLGLEKEATVDIYSDAIRVQPFSLIEQLSDSTQTQDPAYLRFGGTYSPSPSDTLSIESARVQLREVSSLFGWRRLVGGVLDAQLALTKGEITPSVLGNIAVRDFSHGVYLLGDLGINTSLVPNSDALSVDIRLSPSADSARHPTTPSQLVLKENDVRLQGTYTPPRRSDNNLGELDLTATIDRADMFFFEYIFPGTVDNPTGSLSGTGNVSGLLNSPVFGADLQLSDGNFDVPDFNLNYDINGSIDVDADGIHIRQANINDSGGGKALITGSVLFNDYKFFSLDLVGRIDELQIMNVVSSRELPFFGQIAASGTASLSGPLSSATLRSADARTTSDSEVFIPLVAVTSTSDESFIVFADSSGAVPDIVTREARQNVLSRRPRGERSFLDGLDMDLNINAPPGSTIHLVIDPLLGDVINAVGSGRVQLTRREGLFQTFGRLDVTGGDYLFTAGELFIRRFLIDPGGSITWDGDPINASLSIPASYKTRASRAGLPVAQGSSSLIPLIVRLDISGRVSTPEVDLRLEIDADQRNVSSNYEAVEAVLNQPERATEYATSVLITNSFLLTTAGPSTDALASSAFTSVSQLVASQVNRYLSEALPNIDFSFGVSGESAQDLDVTYGIGLRLLDERLVIRGQGVYQGTRSAIDENQSLQGEFVVEVRLSSNVAVEVFYRREGDALTDEAFITNTTGAGLSYQTEFSSWRKFFDRIISRSPEQDETNSLRLDTSDRPEQD